MELVTHIHNCTHFIPSAFINILQVSTPASIALFKSWVHCNSYWYSLCPHSCIMFLLNSGPARFFVNISDSSAIDILLYSMISDSFNSTRKFCFSATWQVLPPMFQLLAMSTAPLLSTSAIIGNFTFKTSDFKILKQVIHSYAHHHSI